MAGAEERFSPERYWPPHPRDTEGAAAEPFTPLYFGALGMIWALQHLRDAVALLETKATPDEVGDYRRFILTLADKVAAAHREHGQSVSDAEQQAITEIAAALGDGS